MQVRTDGSMHLLSVYASFLAHTMSRQRVNKQSVRERRHMLESYIFEFHGLSSEKRASNQEVVIVYSSWPRQILFSRRITFSPSFSSSFRLNPIPYHFSLCRLFIIFPHPPFPLSTTRRFLRQVLCTYVNSSSVNLRVRLPPSLSSFPPFVSRK